MDLFLYGMLYLAIGLLVSVNVYFRAVKSRRMPSVLSVEDLAVLALVAAVVGFVWILFAPVFLIRCVWLLCRWIEQLWGQLLLRLPKLARRQT